MTAVQHTIAEGEHPHHVITMQQPETAKNIHVYLNGDKFYPGRKFVLNRRHVADFDGFLNQVTMGIKAPFGAVRNIYTPQSGHRVQGLNQLQTGMQVVAGGVERFRKMDYRDIGSKRKPKPRRNYLDIKLNPNRMLVSARWRKYVKDPVQIHVFGNGDVLAPALRLLLIPRCMKSWDLVLSEITEKICIRTGQAVRKLYDTNFRLLQDPSELENGHYYIAVGTEKLKKYPYGELHNPTPSPRKITHQPLPPIKRHHKPRPPREDGENTYTKMYVQKKQQKEHVEETTVMGASAATGYRPLRTKKFKPHKPSAASETSPDESTVFPPRPVKVKRLSGISNATHDPHPPSEDGDGVFKTETKEIIAETVAEDENTKVDLPIDQVKALEVDEESIPEVTSTRSDDVIAHDQDTILLEHKEDDIQPSEEHLDDLSRDETSEAHEEADETKPAEEIEDDASVKEEAIAVAETAAIVLTEIPSGLESPGVEDTDKLEEDQHQVEDKVAAENDTSASPVPPEEVEHHDADIVDPEPVDSEVRSEKSEEQESSLEPENTESSPTPDAIIVEENPTEDVLTEDAPVSPVDEALVDHVPTEDAPEEPASPKEDEPVETTEENQPGDNESGEVIDTADADVTHEVPSVEATEEHDEEEVPELGPNEEDQAPTERSLTPSSPKPREEDDNLEVVEGDVPGPEEENSGLEETTVAPEDEAEEEEVKSNDESAVPLPEDQDAGKALTEDASEAVASRHEDEDDDKPEGEDKEEEVKDETTVHKSEDGAVGDPGDSLDVTSEGEGAMARPASEALTADDDKTDPGTPSTKRSLANGDIGGVATEVEP